MGRMTYWATLYYAGSVVISMGYEGQTLDQCNFLGQQMMYDITTAYMDPALEAELTDSVFPTDEFSFVCGTKQLPPAEKFMK